jgi:murein L,D-transpeptidase YcbB/YkuD
MKYIFIYLAFICNLMVACGNAQDSLDGDENGDKNEKKNVSSRNYGINASNSYSDLFLDSSAVEAIITQKKIPDSVAHRIRSFYNTRNYQYAWFSSEGLTEQARGFWSLHEYHTSEYKDTVLLNKELKRKMDALTEEENLTISASNKSIRQTEITLTQHFIHYMRAAYPDGYVKRKEMERFVPYQKVNAIHMADSLLNKKHKDNKYFEDIHLPYSKLKEQLAKYTEIVKSGGWPLMPDIKKKLKKGDSTEIVSVIKRRLHITGDLLDADTSRLFNDSLEMAIKNFQLRHGYKDDGIVSAALIKEMNVPSEKRLQQILMNMGRMRWLPPEPAGELIVVNIPEFMLHVYDGNRRVFDMSVVVGKEGHNTTMFSGDLNQIVFSPYWNVPQSIVKNEILPAIEKNPSYLVSQNMEIVKYTGEYPVIRQLPGPDNALGKVKFLFPNNFNIYFHDTPSKSLFEQSKRAYSHGCIRLSDPEKMANYLLRHQPEWTSERIYEAMNSEEEKYVKLKKPVPVVITYYTAWVDDAGRLNFRDDIYDHDKKLAAKMFQ